MPTVQESLQRVATSGPDANKFRFAWRFGGGLSSTRDPLEIDLREDADGKNYDLKLDRDSFRPRQAFDLLGTAPNGGAIRGLVEFEDSQGVVSNLVQAGGIIYSIDANHSFTQVGTCNPNARLRGGRHSTSLVDDIVLISDLGGVENVLSWDGTTLSEFTTDLANFKAKYIVVVDERAHYANVSAAGTAYPHVMLISGRFSAIGTTELGTVTTSNRPASGLNAGDPVFIPTPDLRPINGLLSAFGLVLMATEGGQIWKLTGSNATDYAIKDLHRGVFVTGDEAILNTGNDVIFGRHGKIDTLLGVEAFGDVQTDDVSRWISEEIRAVTGWAYSAFNPRTEYAYFWADGGNEVWAFHRPIYQRPSRNILGQDVKGVSPWAKWTTDFGNDDFRPTAVQLMRRVADGLDMVYFGDSSGRLFNLEGSGQMDGGSADIAVDRLSGLIQLPFAEVANVRGRVKYRKRHPATLTLTAQYGGTTIKDESITVALPAIEDLPIYGGGFYYNNDAYYGAEFAGRISLRPFQIPGASSLFQIKAAITGDEFDIPEIEIEFEGVPA